MATKKVTKKKVVKKKKAVKKKKLVKKKALTRKEIKAKEERALNRRNLKIKRNTTLVPLHEEMEKSYGEFAVAKLASLLPNSKDGLKIVQRRILFSGYKEARDKLMKAGLVVGKTLTYHPHGDTSVFDTIVNLTRSTTNNYPLFLGQGDFGSVIADVNSHSAARYVEVQLSDFTKDVFFGPELQYMEFVDNYAESDKEPVLLPAKLPYALINGVKSIGVGYACSIPPFHLNSVIEACIAYIEGKPLPFDKMYPEFASGGVVARQPIAKQERTMKTGKGQYTSVVRYEIETGKRGKRVIIVTALPGNMGAEGFVNSLVASYRSRPKKVNFDGLDAITDIRDESSGKDGIRILIDIKKDSDVKKVINVLLNLKSQSFSAKINMSPIMLVGNYEPARLSLEAIIAHWYAFRVTTLDNYFECEINRLKRKIHLLNGYVVMLENLDRFNNIIQHSVTIKTIEDKLKKSFKLDKEQTKFILDSNRRKDMNKAKGIRDEIATTNGEIKVYNKNRKNISKYIINELTELSVKYGRNRRTKIESLRNTVK